MKTKSPDNKKGQDLQVYIPGERVSRPWGGYLVTDVRTNDQGEDVCEKDITLNPGQILSLQSHDMRREHWTVKKGILTILLDGEILTFQEGESVNIPMHAIHCMANASNAPIIIHEIQQGTCREEDVIRYSDPYGRGTIDTSSPTVAASLDAYEKLLKEIGQK